MATYIPAAGDITRKWHLVDADGQTLGRLATRVARILSGKHNPRYTTFLDTGDHVVVINAAKIKITGRKAQQKMYRRYTGFPGGLKSESFEKRIVRRPEFLVEEAIRGMLPSSKLGKAMGKKLKVYRDDKHPHAAQNPAPLKFA